MPSEEDHCSWEDSFWREPDTVEEVSSQKVKTYIYKVGQTKIEFLVPTSEDSTIAKFYPTAARATPSCLCCGQC